MAFSPLITRLYGPEAFGLQGVFTSVVGLLIVVAAMGYPTAIVLPRHDADALGLARLSILIAIGVALLTTIALSIFGVEILRMLNAEAIGALIYLIPLAMIISVLGGVLGQWLIRKRVFGLSARYGVLTTLITSSTKAGLGFLHPTALILIATNTFGALVGTLLTWRGWRKHSSKLLKTNAEHASTPTLTLVQLAKQHRDFPLLRTPQNLINAFSQSLPVLLLASYFGAASAGQYAIAIGVLGMPAGLIGGSVMSVFYPRINEAIHNGEDARALIVKATLGMAAMGVLPFVVILVAGPALFEFVFGKGWNTAGVYAQLLAAWLFFAFINKPVISAIPALKLQGFLLVHELFSVTFRVSALYMGFRVLQSEFSAIFAFSLVGVLLNLFLILYVIAHSDDKRMATR